ncbi:M60 family metallopeptidase [Mycoplasma struthionis]|uniref:Peptidase M60 domain-containing protein n=1 Tax=Mycoplasma struthionis TaxID=538220 RepID=A0A502M311_9MOLU|nr:M60 family metallopeptidase [Mycoplasma struthionis]TPI03013.1 hypothetical protein FJM01_00125 [Mycoplasma struthionis]
MKKTKKMKKILFSITPLMATTGFLALSCIKPHKKVEIISTNNNEAFERLDELNKAARKVSATFKGDKAQTTTKSVTIDQIVFDNFDKEKFKIAQPELLAQEDSIIISFNLMTSDNSLISDKIKLEISGFKQDSAVRISSFEKALEKSSIAMTNNGYFESNDSPMTLSFAPFSDQIQPTKYTWYLNGQKQASTENTFSLSRSSITADAEVALEVTASIENQSFTKKFTQTVHYQNPLSNITLSASNGGKLIDNKAQLTLNLGSHTESLSTTWYFNDEAFRAESFNVASVSSSGTYKAKVTNLEGISFVTNSVTIQSVEDAVVAQPAIRRLQNFSIQDNLNTSIDSITVALKPGVSKTDASTVNQDDLKFTNFDNNTYELKDLSLKPNGNSLNVTFKIKQKNSDVSSNITKTLKIDGFAATRDEQKLLRQKLDASTVVVSNNGYFLSNDDRLSLTFIPSSSDLKITSYKWYKDGILVYDSNVPNLFILNSDLNGDAKYKLEVAAQKDTHTANKTFDNIMVHKKNPLQEIDLNVKNRGLLLDGNSEIALNLRGHANDFKTQWFLYDEEINKGDVINKTSINKKGEYSALLTTLNGIKWKTNSVFVSELEHRNLNPVFASKMTDTIQPTTYSEKILGYKNRTPNNKTYETELLTTYAQYGFKYPGWQYNYEGGDKNSNSFITIPTRSTNNRLNISDLVFNERVPQELDETGQPIKYNNAAWIKKQIANNTLKKHPAADLWYKRRITDDIQAIEKEFFISTQISGPNALGVYIPAGEVAEIEFTPETYAYLKSRYGNSDNNLPFSFTLNKNYWDNRAFNDSGRISNRYPFVQTNFTYKFSEIDPVTRRIKIGSPFGGSITAEIGDFGDDRGKMSLDFIVHNAVENLHYVYGLTTKEDWDRQVLMLKQNKIGASVASLNGYFYSIITPFTDIDRVAGVKFDDLTFPEEAMRKWESFYRGSQVWNDYGGPKIALNYCNDVWGGAGAWGGGGNLWAPIGWSTNYFTKNNQFNFGGWGNYHEINHNFQANQDPFSVNDHGWTNIPSVYNLSYLNDGSRLRNLENVDGSFARDWSILASGYSTALSWEGASWYAMYSNMIYNLGPDNFANWVKASARNGKSWIDNKKGGDPIDTVNYLSKFFKLNLYYALLPYKKLVKTGKTMAYSLPDRPDIQDHSTEINEAREKTNKAKAADDAAVKALDDWRKNYARATGDDKKRLQLEREKINSQLEDTRLAYAIEKSKLDKLLQQYPDQDKITKFIEMEKYPAIDFIGNIYAAGQYLYNSDTRDFEYTADTQAPFEIPGGTPYTFDFEKAINSVNKNFSFKEVTFAPTTKWGGTLQYVAGDNSKKKILYTPNNAYLDRDDEFDVMIIPSESWQGKPSNYVPGYKFKIKIRHVLNKPTLYIYDTIPQGDGLSYGSLDSALQKHQSMHSVPKIAVMDYKTGDINYFRYNSKQPDRFARKLIVEKLKFVAPETGTFDIWGNVDDFGRILINNTKVLDVNKRTNGNKKIGSYEFTKDQIYDIEIITYNWSGEGRANYYLQKDEKKYYFEDYSLSDKLPSEVYQGKVQDILRGDKYQYHLRLKDQHSIDPKLAFRQTPKSDYIRSGYEFSATGPNNAANKGINRVGDNNQDTQYENWGAEDSQFVWTFNEATPVSYFDVFAKKHFLQWKNIPTKYTLHITNEKNEVINLEPIFIRPDQDRSLGDLAGYSIPWRVQLGKTYIVKKIIMDVHRDKPIDDTSSIILADIRWGLETKEVTKVLPVNNVDIQYFGKWDLLDNSNVGISASFNGYAVQSNKEFEYLEFKLKSNQFRLIGKKDVNASSFDVYIDNKRVAENISTASNRTEEKAWLYTFLNTELDPNKEHIVKIVNKEDKPLTLNFFAY